MCGLEAGLISKYLYLCWAEELNRDTNKGSLTREIETGNTSRATAAELVLPPRGFSASGKSKRAESNGAAISRNSRAPRSGRDRRRNDRRPTEFN